MTSLERLPRPRQIIVAGALGLLWIGLVVAAAGIPVELVIHSRREAFKALSALGITIGLLKLVTRTEALPTWPTPDGIRSWWRLLTGRAREPAGDDGDAPVFIVVDVAIDDRATYARYQLLAAPSIADYGGQYVVNGTRGAHEPGAERFVMLEFPSAEAARLWWHSPEYAEAKALRPVGAPTDLVLMEGPSDEQ